MERWLNSRAAKAVAWTIVGLMAAGAAGFALFLLWPLATGSGTGGGADAPLPSASVAAVPSSTPAPGRVSLRGSVNRVEGQALVIRMDEGGGTARVLLRGNSPIGSMTGAAPADIKAGEPVALTIRRQSDGRNLVIRVRLQPPELPPTVGDAQHPGAGDPTTVTGTVVAYENNRIRVQTARGEQPYDVTAAVRVDRFVPMAAADLRAGQRVLVDGERLIDGTVAALVVQVFDPR